MDLLLNDYLDRIYDMTESVVVYIYAYLFQFTWKMKEQGRLLVEPTQHHYPEFTPFTTKRITSVSVKVESEGTDRRFLYCQK